GTREEGSFSATCADSRRCARRRGRRTGRDGSLVRGRHARDRPVVRDQDRRPAARVRADGEHRQPRRLRHAVDVPGRRRRTSGSDARGVVHRVEGREDVHLQAEEERPLRGRDAADLRRRRLLVQSPDQPEGQSILLLADVSVAPKGKYGVGLPFQWPDHLEGQPILLLADVSVAPKGKYGVVLKSKTPNTALPAILANTSLGIVNSKLVKAHGGTDAADADKTDKAEQWFNSSSSVGAGSGPYVLKQYSTTSQIVLTPNTKYWGPNKAKWSSVVVRNMIAATQLINIQRGSHEVAIDLASDQAQSLRGNKKLKVSLTPST